MINMHKKIIHKKQSYLQRKAIWRNGIFGEMNSTTQIKSATLVQAL